LYIGGDFDFNKIYLGMDSPYLRRRLQAERKLKMLSEMTMEKYKHLPIVAELKKFYEENKLSLYPY